MSRSPLKRKDTAFMHPDPAVSSTLQSIRQNPKFAKLLGFSMNALGDLLRKINPKHRNNAKFIIDENGHKNLVQALTDHNKVDAIICASCNCLIKIINSDKYYEEEFSKKIAEEGIVKAIHLTFRNGVEKSPESYAVLLALIRILANSRVVVPDLIDGGLMLDLILIAQDPKISDAISKDSLEALLKLANTTRGKAEIAKSDFINSILGLIEKKISNEGIVESGMKILEAVCNTKEGLEMLRKDSNAMKIIVPVLQKHPHAKFISDSAVSILPKLSTIDDIERAFNAVKCGDMTQIPLLASLLVVDDFLTFILQKGAIKELISLLNTQQNPKSDDQLELIRNISIALGRICVADDKNVHEIINQGGLDVLAKFLDVENVEVIIALLDTLKRLAINNDCVQKLIERGVIEKIMKKAQSFSKNERFGESFTHFIASISTFEAGRKSLSQVDYILLLFGIIKQFSDNKRVQEQGLKALAALVDENGSLTLAKADLVGHLSVVNNKHQDWVRASLSGIKLLDVVTRYQGAVSAMNKEVILAMVVDILTKQVKVEEESANEDSQKQNLLEDLNELSENKAQEKLSYKQEQELRDSSVSILEKIIDVDQVTALKQKIEQLQQDFLKKGDANTIKNLTFQMKILTTVVLIPKIAKYIVSEMVPHKVAELSKKIYQQGDLEAIFFGNIGHLNKDILDLIREKQVQNAAIEVMNNCLERLSEQAIIEIALKSLQALISSLIIVHNDVVDNKQDKGFFSQQLSTTDLIDLVLMNIKKFPGVEEVALSSIRLFNAAVVTNSEYIAIMSRLGAPNVVATLLENEYLSNDLGKEILQFLSYFMNDEEFLNYLLTIDAITSIMSLQSKFRNSKEIGDISNPLLKKLSEISAQEKLKRAESLISDYLLRLVKYQVGKTSKQDLIEALVGLLELSLIPEGIEFIDEKKGIGIISRTFIAEIEKHIETIIDQGDEEFHESVIEDLLILNQRLYNNSVAKHKILIEYTEDLTISNLIEALTTRRKYPNIIRTIIATMNGYLHNETLKESLISSLLSKEIVPALFGILEFHKEDLEITNSTLQILMILAKESQAVTSRLGNKSFIRSLVKKTRNLIRHLDDNPSGINEADQNLKCLRAIASERNNAAQVRDEGGVELSFQAISLRSKELPQLEAIPISELSLALNQAGVESKSQVDTLATLAIELLKNMLWSAELAEKSFDIKELQHVLTLLDDLSNSRRINDIIDFLEKASESNSISAYLGENACVDRLMRIANSNSTHKPLLQKIGLIIRNLGGNALIPEIVNQIEEFKDGVITKDPDSVVAYQGACLYLANLFTSPRDVDSESDSMNRFISLLEKCFDPKGNEPQLIATQLIAIERMTVRDPSVCVKLRISPLSQIIVEKSTAAITVDEENTKLVEMLLDTIYNLLEEPKEHVLVLDGNTGEEIVQKRESNTLISSFFSENGRSIGFLLQVLKQSSNQQNAIQKKNFEKSAAILAILSHYDECFGQFVINLDGLPTICQLASGSTLKTSTKNQQRLIQTLSNIANSKTGYDSLVNNGILKTFSQAIQETPFEILRDPKSQGVQTLNSLLVFFENLLNNDYDHGPILDCSVLKGLISLFENFKEIGSKDLPNLDHISEILKNSFICLQRMARDPILLRALSKLGGVELGLIYLNKVSDAVALNPHEEIDPEKLSNLEKMTSSDKLLDRAAEAILGFFTETSKNAKYAKDIPILNPEASAYQDLLNFPSSRADSPIISFRMLKIFHSFLIAIGKETILQAQEMVSPIGDVSDTMVQIYPKIAIINDLSKELKLLISNGTLDEPKVVEVVIQKDFIEELKQDFEKLADHLEEVIKKIISQQASEKELEDATKLLDFIFETPIDDTDSDKLSKLEQYGVSQTIAKAIISENPNDLMAIRFLNIMNKFIKHPKQLEKIIEDRDFNQNLIEKVNKSNGITDLKKEILQKNLCLLKDLILYPGSEAKVNYNDALDSLLTAVTNNPEDLDTLIPSLQGITKIISINEIFAEKLVASDALNMLSLSVTKFSDLEKLRQYATFINKTTVSDKIREIYGKSQVISKLLEANLKFKTDEILNVESLNAYSKLVINNIQNSTELIGSEGFEYFSYILNQNIKAENQITGALMTLQNITRVKMGKELLSKYDFISLLLSGFKVYSQLEETKQMISILRVLGNLSIIKSNSDNILKTSFIDDLGIIIKASNSNSELIKIILCVLVNITSDSTGINSSILLKSKTIKILFEYFGNPERKTDECLNYVELLGNLSNTNDNIHVLNQLGAIEIHINLLKTQEFNPDIVSKTLKNLLNLISSQEMIQIVFDLAKAIQILNSVAKIHKKLNHIILSILKIFNRLSNSLQNIKNLFELESLDVLVGLMQENSYQLQTLVGFFKVFMKFSVEDECCELICEKGAISMINSIQQNIQNEKFVKLGTGLLSSLLMVENGVYAILNNKGAELLANSLTFYPSTDTIVMNCCSALSSIIIHTLEVPFKLKELEFPKILSKVYSHEENKEKNELKSEVFMTAHFFYGTSKEKVEEKSNIPPQRKSVLIDPLKVHLMAGTIVKMWSKDGSKKEMHFYASQDLDELLAKKPISTQPEQEFRLKIVDILNIVKGYDNESPFAKPKGWMKKKPNKNNCLTITGKPGCNTLYVECGLESDCNKWMEYITSLKEHPNAPANN